MSAPEGNQFWKMRSRHGRKPDFDGPAKLEEACCDYFEWVEANPLFEDTVSFYEGDPSHEPRAKMQAMTIAGLCLFIDISIKQWTEWRTKRVDLGEVISWAETVIKHQKFTGAAAGLLNANIIARDLGLGDTTNIQARDKNGDKADLTDPFSALLNAKITEAEDGKV